MKVVAIILAACFAASCDAPETDDHSGEQEPYAEYLPPPGSNQMLRAPITISDGLEVIISDVVIPPNATVSRHYHPGEEFLYVLKGSAVHVEEGNPDRVLQAGDAYVISPRAVHAPRGGPEGARAVVFRVHIEGMEERTLVEQRGNELRYPRPWAGRLG